jgi:hypothetical protein
VILYEYVESVVRAGRRMVTDRVITDWPAEQRQRRGLKARLVMLLQVDRDQAVGSLIFKTKTEGIYYAKIRGNIALRPRLCLGPKDPEREVTFLERAHEENFRIVPADASARALVRMKQIQTDDLHRMRIDVDALA